jgi:alkylation response protein AidB-like acyl-CoA dehydrogenase
VEFELSADQQALAGAARSVLDGMASSADVRTHLTSGEPYDVKLWQAMIDQGWLGVALPEERGGLGLGFVELAILLEELGRHVAPVPFLPSVLALDTLHLAGVDQWTSRLLSGEAIGCMAWASPRSRVTVEGDTLSGRPDPVVAGPVADVVVVLTADAVYLADLLSMGRPQREAAMDVTQALGWVTFDRSPVTRLGGAELAERLLERAAVAWCADLLGGASRVLDMTADYAKQRVQFGRPIGSFQAVKHRCADMVVDVEGMRSSVWYAAWCLSAGHSDGPAASSAAKVWSADAAKRVMASGLQIHGGIGFTWDHDLHLYLKRSQLGQVAFGDASYHRGRLASLLQRRVEAGEPVV